MCLDNIKVESDHAIKENVIGPKAFGMRWQVLQALSDRPGRLCHVRSLSGGVQVTHFENWPFSRLLIDLLFPEIPEQVTPHWNHRKNVHFEKKRLLVQSKGYHNQILSTKEFLS